MQNSINHQIWLMNCKNTRHWLMHPLGKIKFCYNSYLFLFLINQVSLSLSNGLSRLSWLHIFHILVYKMCAGTNFLARFQSWDWYNIIGMPLLDFAYRCTLNNLSSHVNHCLCVVPSCKWPISFIYGKFLDHPWESFVTPWFGTTLTILFYWTFFENNLYVGFMSLPLRYERVWTIRTCTTIHAPTGSLDWRWSFPLFVVVHVSGVECPSMPRVPIERVPISG